MPNRTKPRPNVLTLESPFGQAQVTVLTGAPLPIRQARERLAEGGCYVVLTEPGGALTPHAYVGKGGDCVQDRIAARRRLLGEGGEVSVIAITAAGRLAGEDAKALERLVVAALDQFTDLVVENDMPPAHQSIDPARYAALRALLGEALLRIAASGLITFTVPNRALLAGPKVSPLWCHEPIAEGTPMARHRLRHAELRADAVEFADGRAKLERGAIVRAMTAGSAHGGQHALRQEALFSGILTPCGCGLAHLTRDLIFASLNYLKVFVAGSANGVSNDWSIVDPSSPAGPARGVIHRDATARRGAPLHLVAGQVEHDERGRAFFVGPAGAASPRRRDDDMRVAARLADIMADEPSPDAAMALLEIWSTMRRDRSLGGAATDARP